jgi:anhydro-N-acetylmuramic acid kinase
MNSENALPRSWTGVGLMSGSSLDGLDLCAVRFTEQPEGGYTWELGAAYTEPYPMEWVERLRRAPAESAETLAKLNVDYGHWVGLTLRRFLVETGTRPDFVSSHGHTVLHQPAKHFTCQIGDGETLANYLTVPLVCNFRSRDIGQGGQGAPLVPVGEQDLFPDYRAFLNLGGIANLSLQHDPAEAPDITWRPGRYLAFDVCPCNQLLNALARRHDPTWSFDPDGQLADTGSLVPQVLETLENWVYYTLYPPKSLGNEVIWAELWPVLAQSSEPIPDLLYTVCWHIANRVAAEVNRFQLTGRSILVTGGGAHNRCLVRLLTERLTELGCTPVQPEARVVDYKEALIFAYLGLLRLRGKPTVLASATGCKKPMSTGSIHLPTGQGIW